MKMKTRILILAAALGVSLFFIVSLIMASVNGHSIVAEWQSWFGIAKQATDNVVEATKAFMIG